jgi:glycerol-3-phosphate acyltransferase PlsY
MNSFLVLPAAYLLGAIPFGYLLVKWKTGGDVRAAGSGNIGATNVLRTTGRLAGFTTLVMDAAKGFVAVWLADRLTGGNTAWMSAAALAAMLGHAYPVFLRFHGGKAVATFVGSFLYVAPLAVAATLVVFVATVAWTRFISLGSVVGAASFPLAVWLILHPPWPVVAAAVAGGAFIIWRHSANIRRLRAGKENAFTFRGRK